MYKSGGTHNKLMGSLKRDNSLSLSSMTDNEIDLENNKPDAFMQAMRTINFPYSRGHEFQIQSLPLDMLQKKPLLNYTRTVKDINYYKMGVNNKMHSIKREIDKLKTEMGNTIMDQTRYEKRIKELATDLTEKQIALTDYNFLNNWITTAEGDLPSTIALNRQIRQLREENEIENKNQDAIFHEKANLTARIQSVQHEMDEENSRILQTLSCDSGLQKKYNKLKEHNLKLESEKKNVNQKIIAMRREMDTVQNPLTHQLIALTLQLEKLEKRKTEMDLRLLQRHATKPKLFTINEECDFLQHEILKLNKAIKNIEMRRGKFKRLVFELDVDEQEMENFLWSAEYNIKQEESKLKQTSDRICEKLQILMTYCCPTNCMSEKITLIQLKQTLNELTKDIDNTKRDIEAVKNNMKIKSSETNLLERMTSKDQSIQYEDYEAERTILKKKFRQRQKLIVEMTSLLKYRQTKLSNNPIHNSITKLENNLAKVEQEHYELMESLNILIKPEDLEIAKKVTLNRLESVNSLLKLNRYFYS